MKKEIGIGLLGIVVATEVAIGMAKRAEPTFMEDRSLIIDYMNDNSDNYLTCKSGCKDVNGTEIRYERS